MRTYAMRFILLLALDVAAHLVPQTMHLWAPLDLGVAIAYAQTVWVWRRERAVVMTGG